MADCVDYKSFTVGDSDEEHETERIDNQQTARGFGGRR